MTEILKRDDPRIANCAIVDGEDDSYAQLPTGYRFQVERPKDVIVHADGSTTTSDPDMYDSEVWAPAPVNHCGSDCGGGSNPLRRAIEKFLFITG